MTTEVELLPLYAELQGHPKIEIIKHYARANVARAIAAKDAEIEALRAEVETWKTYARGKHDLWQESVRHAERLAEALRRYRNEVPLGHQPHMLAHEVDDLLRDQEARND